ncbi:MAG: nucleotide exchange factor GrpE [Prevotella sp.]|nr:nucleotide exchange factor GrpE [Prevotella sp.]
MSKENKENKDIELEEKTSEVENPETAAEASENQESAEAQESSEAKDGEKAAEAPKEPSLEEQIEELKKQALYKQAEFENFRKRTLKEKADLILAGGEKTITAILPVLDDFERAMADQSDDPAAIKEGMKLIFQKFQKTLESLGVKKIETDGVDFNVDYHEAIAQVPGMGEDKVGKVIDCVQTGYTLNDKVIRFAKVAVGQ